MKYNGIPKQFFKSVKYVCKNYNENDSNSIENFNVVTKLFADILPDRIYEYALSKAPHNLAEILDIIERTVGVANDTLKISYPNRKMSVEYHKNNLYMKFSKTCKNKNIKVKKILMIENFTQIDNSFLDTFVKDIRNKVLDYEAKYSYKRVVNVNL